MKVAIKTANEIEKMRIAGRLAAEVLEMIQPEVKPGASTGHLDRLCHQFITEVQQAIPAPLHYRGFPKSICTSLNHVICHGIPSDTQYLKEGDIINLDVTVIKDGWHGDTSAMFFVGEVPTFAKRLCTVTQECLYRAIATVRPGSRLSTIGAVIAEHAKKHHYSIVEEYCGHGIGRAFHEDPQILHYPEGYHKKGADLVLEKGMTFTIEPMINLGKKHNKLQKDGWTVVTKDRSLSAQWEHTIAVTDAGFEILTLRQSETAAPKPA